MVSQEEEAEEEGEAERMAEWDRKAADEAYRQEVERALQHQKLLDEQFLAEQLALVSCLFIMSAHPLRFFTHLTMHPK